MLEIIDALGVEIDFANCNFKLERRIGSVRHCCDNLRGWFTKSFGECTQDL